METLKTINFVIAVILIVSRICLYAERPAEMRAFFILQRRTKIWDLLILSARKTA